MLIKKPGTESAEYFLTYAEFKKLPIDKIKDCAIAYIKDWYRLDSDTKTELGNSQIQMFDVAERIWMPQ